MKFPGIQRLALVTAAFFPVVGCDGAGSPAGPAKLIVQAELAMPAQDHVRIDVVASNRFAFPICIYTGSPGDIPVIVIRDSDEALLDSAIAHPDVVRAQSTNYVFVESGQSAQFSVEFSDDDFPIMRARNNLQIRKPQRDASAYKAFLQIKARRCSGNGPVNFAGDFRDLNWSGGAGVPFTF